jgi:hypothetical protein
MTDLWGFSRYMELMRERLTRCISANGVQCNPFAHRPSSGSPFEGGFGEVEWTEQ